MILAAYRDGAYNVVLFVHVVAFLVAFAPAIINPMLEGYFRKNGGDEAIRNWAGFAAGYTRTMALGSLGLLLVTGIAMIVMADAAIEFSDVWISASFVVWLALAGVVSAVILKGEQAVADGDLTQVARVRVGGMVGTGLLLLMLYLMVFKPGSPLT